MRGTLLILLFYGLAPGITWFLLWVCVRRALREADKRVEILLAAGLALAVWTIATYATIAIVLSWVPSASALPDAAHDQASTVFDEFRNAASLSLPTMGG